MMNQSKLNASISLDQLTNDEFHIVGGAESSEIALKLQGDIQRLTKEIADKEASSNKTKQTMKTLETLNKKFKSQKTTYANMVSGARSEVTMLLERFQGNKEVENSLIKILESLKQRQKDKSAVSMVMQFSEGDNMQEKFEKLKADLNIQTNQLRIAKKQKEQLEKKLLQNQSYLSEEIKRLEFDYQEKLKQSRLHISKLDNSKDRTIQDLNQQIESLKSQVKELNKLQMKNEMLKEKLSTKESEVEKIHQEMKRLNEQNVQLFSQIQEKNQEKIKLKEIISAKQAAFQKQREKLNQKLLVNPSIDESNTEIHTENQELKRKNQAIQQKLKALENIMVDKDVKIQNLQVQVAQSSKVMQPFLNDKEEQLTSLRIKCNRLEQQMKKKLEQPAETQSFQSQLLIKEQEIKKMHQQIKTLKQSLLKMKENESKANKTITQIEEKFQNEVLSVYEKDGQIKSLMIQVDQLNEQCEKLKEECKIATDKLEKKTEEYQKIMSETKDLRAKAKQSQKIMADLRKEVEDTNRSQLQAFANDSENKKINQDLAMENEKLTKVNLQFQRKHKQLQSSYESLKSAQASRICSENHVSQVLTSLDYSSQPSDSIRPNSKISQIQPQLQVACGHESKIADLQNQIIQLASENQKAEQMIREAQQQSKQVVQPTPQIIVQQMSNIATPMKPPVFFRFKNNIMFHLQAIEERKFAEKL